MPQIRAQMTSGQAPRLGRFADLLTLPKPHILNAPMSTPTSERFRRVDAVLDAVLDLPADEQDKLLSGLEDGSIKLKDVDVKAFFAMVLQDTQQGFFADPIYGGNRNMAGWKLVGFPGARYDYREWVERHNEPYPLPPVSIMGRAEWAPKG